MYQLSLLDSPAVGEGMDVPSLVHIHTQIFFAHHSPSPLLSKSIFPTPMDNWINKWVTKCNVQLLSYYYSASLKISTLLLLKKDKYCSPKLLLYYNDIS
jgi:hypothetical protein